jgi:anti-sigma B factor antagonist
MTTVLPSVSSELVDLVRPGRCPGPELLTVTAQPMLPRAVVIAVRDDVGLGTSPLLQDSLLAHLRHACPPLVIDLTDVGYFAAAGLTVLTAREAAVAAGAELCVVANSRLVLLPLTITGLDHVFDIHPNRTQAPLWLGGGPAE